MPKYLGCAKALWFSLPKEGTLGGPELQNFNPRGKLTMDELIQQLTSKLGIDSSVAGAAADKAMALVKEQAGDDLFSKISSAIPGASESADQGADASSDGGGGMLGSLASAASGLMGGSAGNAVEFGSSLSAAGLDPSQLGSFATTVIDFLKEKVGSDVIDQVLDKVPMLKSLVG